MGDVNLTSRQLLLMKTETNYGVDADPSEANSFEAMRMVDPFTIEIDQNFVEQIGGNLTRGFDRPIPTTRPAGVTFRSYVTGIGGEGSYTATVKPPLADAFRACGLFETFTASNASGQPEYRYDPGADIGSDTSVTIIPNQDGLEHRILGCRGNVNFIYSAAGPVVAEFVFRGLLSTEVETTRATPTGLPSTIPPRWIDSGSIIVGSLSANVENLNLNTNNTLFEQPASSALSGSGIVAILITNRAPGGSFDPEVTRTSSHDFLARWRSASQSVIQLNTGITAGNRFTLVASKAIYKNVSWSDKSGLSVFATDFQAYETSADDEIRLSFTTETQ